MRRQNPTIFIILYRYYIARDYGKQNLKMGNSMKTIEYQKIGLAHGQ